MLKFYYNGIKENGGKLQLCYYSDGELVNFPEGTITLYGRHYARDFSAEVNAQFDVTNDSDYQSDLVSKDCIRIKPDHPLYAQVKAAADLAKAHNANVGSKRHAHYIAMAQQIERAA